MATNPRGGGVGLKALVAGPLRKDFFLRLPWIMGLKTVSFPLATATAKKYYFCMISDVQGDQLYMAVCFW